MNGKESEEIKIIENTVSTNIKSNFEALENKPVKKKNKNNSETYSQGYDTLKCMKTNPPKLPNIYNHDYDLKNTDINSNNETCGIINKGTIPVVFFGHIMTKKKKTFNKLSITQRNKKKLVTILYYTP